MSEHNRSEFRIGEPGDAYSRPTDVREFPKGYNDHDPVPRPVIEVTAEHGFAIGHIAFRGEDFPPVESED